MFEKLTLLQLQQYWWFIISLLGGLFVFILFVQGGQTLIGRLSKGDEVLKTILINSLGRKWELGFTTLVLFGGALFAAFPLFYSTSFGGAYFIWMAILFCFIVQAISYEYRKKPKNFLGQRIYETFLYINGSLGVILLGIMIATFFSGLLFTLDLNNFWHWESSLRGIESLSSIFNLSLGFTLFFLVRISGALYFINNIDNKLIKQRSVYSIKIDMIIFLFFFLLFIFLLFEKDGYAYNSLGIVHLQRNKYLQNFFDMPYILSMFLIGVFMVIIAVIFTIHYNKISCIKIAGIGIVLTVMSLFLNVGFNHTAFYPSSIDLQSSLTIQNSSGSHYTLTTMSYVSLLIPFVLSYITYVWYQMDKVKITKEEMENLNLHNY